MGNGIAKLTVCFTGGSNHRQQLNNGTTNISSVLISPDQLLDEGLGHSFCYVRPDPACLSSSKVHHSDESSAPTTTTFRTISGASVSANTSTTATSATYVDAASAAAAASSTFESSTSFASLPLQPIPRNLLMEYSGPLPSLGLIPGSGPMERGFMSGPIERGGFMSGPLDRFLSGPIIDNNQFQRSFSVSYNGQKHTRGSKKQRIIRALTRAIKTVSFSQSSNSIVAPVKNGPDPSSEFMNQNNENINYLTVSSSDGSLLFCDDDYDSIEKSQSLHWAQGKAGEDRVHVVVSEEHGWVFVGIYDGFSGPDAPDFLLSNLYPQVHRELKGLLWDDEKLESGSPVLVVDENRESRENGSENCENCLGESEGEKPEKLDSGLKIKGRSFKKGGKFRENQARWKYEWDRERLELDMKLKEQLNKNRDNERLGSMINHGDVLKALSQALKKTEDSYLDIADTMLNENPELSLMGSCVLVMLMKGEDVYVMNVGDSRAVLAQKAEPDYGLGKSRQDLERINEETLRDLEAFDGEKSGLKPSLSPIQLSVDHSTSVNEEVQRIRNEHPDDARAIVNNRVKGSLKVTRAFGAGYLKQRKWNDALLERFRIDYVGNSPYVSCSPSLYHHRLGPKDQFLILSSDGLYQYLTNEEAVSEVELFIALQPEGDPAQHLVEEVLFRAAKKAGMDFHELLEIPQGDRRRYHDDISIIVISLEGRIWRSCV